MPLAARTRVGGGASASLPKKRARGATRALAAASREAAVDEDDQRQEHHRDDDQRLERGAARRRQRPQGRRRRRGGGVMAAVDWEAVAKAAAAAAVAAAAAAVVEVTRSADDGGGGVDTLLFCGGTALLLVAAAAAVAPHGGLARRQVHVHARHPCRRRRAAAASPGPAAPASRCWRAAARPRRPGGQWRAHTCTGCCMACALDDAACCPCCCLEGCGRRGPLAAGGRARRDAGRPPALPRRAFLRAARPSAPRGCQTGKRVEARGGGMSWEANAQSAVASPFQCRFAVLAFLLYKINALDKPRPILAMTAARAPLVHHGFRHDHCGVAGEDRSRVRRSNRRSPPSGAAWRAAAPSPGRRGLEDLASSWTRPWSLSTGAALSKGERLFSTTPGSTGSCVDRLRRPRSPVAGLLVRLLARVLAGFLYTFQCRGWRGWGSSNWSKKTLCKSHRSQYCNGGGPVFPELADAQAGRGFLRSV